MASLAIHKVIADKYIDNNKIEDKVQFYEGTYFVDIVGDKYINHYSTFIKNDSYADKLCRKVDLVKFCAEHKIDTDFDKAYFLHLVTDYIFYTKYLLQFPILQDLKNQEVARQIVYNEYGMLNGYIEDRYGIDIEDLPESGRLRIKGQLNIMSVKDIDYIIDYCASLDLDKVYDSVSKGDYGVFDNCKINIQEDK
ncbi:MAG: hypothetical protein E7361_03265 [Clostridiales bacterium]|nr:hypothetical protein [Clostridiales bacterium]